MASSSASSLPLWRSIDWKLLTTNKAVVDALYASGCVEISLGDDTGPDPGESVVYHGTNLSALNKIAEKGEMKETKGAGSAVVKKKRKDKSENAAYVSPEFWTAYRYLVNGLGVIIVAILPPTNHDTERGIIYRVPRKKGKTMGCLWQRLEG